ncbi:MAG: sigma-54-dependent transcriptional regulator [Janthinobacterium lividum]
MSSSASTRSVILVTADAALREQLRASLAKMRWNIREASGGAEALAHLEDETPEALLVDLWLPDLEVGAFMYEVHQLYPKTEVVRFDGVAESGEHRSAYRVELLQAIREVASGFHTDSPSGRASSTTLPSSVHLRPESRTKAGCAPLNSLLEYETSSADEYADSNWLIPNKNPKPTIAAIPGLVGQSSTMMELARLVRLVAPHAARVLIEGQTGTGKELVAKALHALSPRVKKPFVVLNCAAIPEALLEAELFGHTRGAFTGAVQSRIGRIEAAHGGTLFLDEIGEMPLSLQSKLLRFLENGELQRVGDNEPVRVDVRVIAATHQRLEERAEQGTFRLDLFHRLAVFPIAVPSLLERLEDLPAIAEHFLAQYAKESPRKRLSIAAIEKLMSHPWPGNVRELANVLQRAVILTDDEPIIGPLHIVLRHSKSA